MLSFGSARKIDSLFQYLYNFQYTMANGEQFKTIIGPLLCINYQTD